MKDIQWMKSKLDKHAEVFPEEGEYLGLKSMVDVNLVDELLFELEVLKTPVIPKFIAKYIEERTQAGDKLIHAISCPRNNKVFNWLLEGENSELFAVAWRYGYVVEKR